MKRESERFYAMQRILDQHRERPNDETADSLQSALELMRT